MTAVVSPQPGPMKPVPNMVPVNLDQLEAGNNTGIVTIPTAAIQTIIVDYPVCGADLESKPHNR